MLYFGCRSASLICILCLASIVQSGAQNPDINIGDVFMLQLAKSSYFSDTDALPTDPVRFIASKLHHPDTPAWLTFLQRNQSEDAFLYGSPKQLDDSLALEVVAVNQRSFQTAYKIYHITVLPDQYNDAGDLHVAELWILNYNVEEILKGKHISILTRRLKRLWPDADELRLINVFSIAELTGRVPVPTNPGQDITEGVIVQLGSSVPFSDDLKNAAQEVHNGDCQVAEISKMEINKRFTPEYYINWCELKLIEPVSEPDTPDGLGAALGSSPPWVPRSANIPRQDMMIDFILTVVLPLSLGIIFFIILSYIMCGRRQSKAQRDGLMSQPQLEQFNSIRAAMLNLRLMSNYRDGPPSLSPVHTTGPSNVNTLTRAGDMGTAPPPYRIPPSYSAHDSPGSADQAVDQPVNGNHGNSEADQQNLMPQGSPETLKVRK